MRELSRSAISRVSGGQINTTSEGMAVAGAIGGGVVASKIIETVGGGSITGLIEKMGMAALPIGAVGAAGIGASWYAGKEAGTWLYDNSETVRSVSGKAVEAVMEFKFAEYFERNYGDSAGFPRTSDGQMAFDP
jgi:hypothetical protein